MLGRTERAAVTVRAVQVVVDALGHGEEARIALDDDPAGIDPGAPRVASSVCSSSATPPPVAVELTFSTMRPSSSLRMEAAVTSKPAPRSGPMIASIAAGGTGRMRTSSSPMAGT